MPNDEPVFMLTSICPNFEDAKKSCKALGLLSDILLLMPAQT